jgi:hypothetical protein
MTNRATRSTSRRCAEVSDAAFGLFRPGCSALPLFVERFDPWFADILARKPGKVAAVAMANKTARMVWAVLTRNEPYRVRTI